MTVTASETQAAMLATGRCWFPTHQCSICAAPVGYQIVGESIYFDGACDCAQGPLRDATWQDAANAINDTSEPEALRVLRVGFGLDKA